ncbi:ribonuclease H2, subunit C [Amylocystis lapponica]|nr:ribonuclease H2, subunit C [Amylocystis lapponica]
MSTLALAPVPDPLPQCTPSLMPFHIAHSGPAPVSTYFRPKPAPPPSYGKEETRTPPSSSTSQSTLVATSSSATLDSSAPPASASPSLATRFVAAFRGRTVQGLTVDLPTGYAGLVLQTPDAAKDKVDKARKDADARDAQAGQSKKAGKRGASLRSSARAAHGDVDAVAEDPRGDEGPRVRVLRPTSAFSSFVLWSPDIAVDEGSDEYLRSLSEWTRLAAEIHHFEADG